MGVQTLRYLSFKPKRAPDVGSVAGEDSLLAGVADHMGIFRLYKAALVPGCKPQLEATFQLQVS